MLLPWVRTRFNFRSAGFKSDEKLLVLEDGRSYLSQFTIGRGNVYLFSSNVDPELTDFAKHSLFVPTFYNMALNSQYRSALQYVIGNETKIEINNDSKGETIYHLISDEIDIIPEVKHSSTGSLLYFHDQIEKSGNYKLNKNNASIGMGLAFNYSRRESEPDCYDIEELEALIQKNAWSNVELVDSTQRANLAQVISFQSQGKALWKYCLIFALIFMGLELVFTKFLKE